MPESPRSNEHDAITCHKPKADLMWIARCYESNPSHGVAIAAWQIVGVANHWLVDMGISPTCRILMYGLRPKVERVVRDFHTPRIFVAPHKAIVERRLGLYELAKARRDAHNRHRRALSLRRRRHRRAVARQGLGWRQHERPSRVVRSGYDALRLLSLLPTSMAQLARSAAAAPPPLTSATPRLGDIFSSD